MPRKSGRRETFRVSEKELLDGPFRELPLELAGLWLKLAALANRQESTDGSLEVDPATLCAISQRRKQPAARLLLEALAATGLITLRMDSIRGRKRPIAFIRLSNWLETNKNKVHLEDAVEEGFSLNGSKPAPELFHPLPADPPRSWLGGLVEWGAEQGFTRSQVLFAVEERRLWSQQEGTPIQRQKRSLAGWGAVVQKGLKAGYSLEGYIPPATEGTFHVARQRAATAPVQPPAAVGLFRVEEI